MHHNFTHLVDVSPSVVVERRLAWPVFGEVLREVQVLCTGRHSEAM